MWDCQSWKEELLKSALCLKWAYNNTLSNNHTTPYEQLLGNIGKKNPNFFRNKPLHLAGSTDRAVQNDLQWWWREGPSSFSGKCAHSWLIFAREHLTTGSTKTGALFSSQLKGGSHKAHVTDMKQSGGANVMLPAATETLWAINITQPHCDTSWIRLLTRFLTSLDFNKVINHQRDGDFVIHGSSQQISQCII